MVGAAERRRGYNDLYLYCSPQYVGPEDLPREKIMAAGHSQKEFVRPSQSKNIVINQTVALTCDHRSTYQS